MARKQVPFYGTHHDVVEVVREFAGDHEIDFVRAGTLGQAKMHVVSNFAELSEFETYLIAYRGASMQFEEIALRQGGRAFALDQARNPDTIVFRMGGVSSHDQLLPGSLGTTSNTKASDQLYSICSKVIRGRFEKIRSFYVGPEALKLLDGGGRLSVTEKSPREYDLVRQASE